MVQQGTLLTRSVLVNISGSLTHLAMQGTQAALWKPVDGKQIHVFGMGSNADAQVVINQLRTALIHDVTLLEHRSTFPVPMGVTIGCIPANEKTDEGESYTYTVLPQSVISSPQLLFKCDIGSEEGMEWRRSYPKYNAQNIDTEGIIDVPNATYVLVDKEHPTVHLLRHNSSLIGVSVDDSQIIDNKWFKVARQTMQVCVDALRAQVLSKVASNNLNLFQVQLTRLNAMGWDDIDVPLIMQSFQADTSWDMERLELEKKAHAERFITKPYSYMARLQVTYELQGPQ